MSSFSTQSQPQNDDARAWIGGEATIGSQAGRHVRRQAGTAPHLLSTILGLTFIGGLAMGSAFGLLCRTKSK